MESKCSLEGSFLPEKLKMLPDRSFVRKHLESIVLERGADCALQEMDLMIAQLQILSFELQSSNKADLDKAEGKGMDKREWSLKILTNNSRSLLLNAHPSWNFLQLQSSVMNIVGMKESSFRLFLGRSESGKEIRGPGDLTQLGLHDRSTIFVKIETKTPMQQEHLQTQEKIEEDIERRVIGLISPAIGSGRCVPKTTHAAITLAFHCFLLLHGFICNGTDDTAAEVAGFAPPIRDVPTNFLVPAKWAADEFCISLRYRHKDDNTKVFLLKALVVGSKSMIHLSEKSGAIETLEIDPIEFVKAEAIAKQPPSPATWFKSLEQLFNVFKPFVDRILPSQKNETVHMTWEVSIPDGNGPLENVTRIKPTPPLDRPTNPLMDNTQPPVGPFGTGGIFEGDLDPFGRGGGLGLVGPNHPIFIGQDPHQGFPQPRFDPYGPEPDPDHLPVPGFFPHQGGRGRGRGRAPARPFGDPNPDHLQPPNFWNGNGSGFL